MKVGRLCHSGFCKGSVSSSCESEQHVAEERSLVRSIKFNILSGVYHKKLNYLATRHGSQRNFSRCLHTLIHKKGYTLPVEIHAITTKVRILRQRKVVSRPWPVLYMSSFDKYKGFYLVGGQKTWYEVQSMFTEFWARHASSGGSTPEHPNQTLPIWIHGDEGRGLGKRPLLVVSYQPVIGWRGPAAVTSSGCLACIYRIINHP